MDCAKKAKYDLSSTLKKYNVTCRQGIVLRTLDDTELSAKEIGEICSIDKATLSLMLKKLTDHHFIEYHENMSDKREKCYRLTESGKTLLPDIFRVENEYRATITANMTDEEYHQLTELLKKLKASYDQQQEETK
jgi:DNA-binding MarR family transcriptional regulator